MRKVNKLDVKITRALFTTGTGSKIYFRKCDLNKHTLKYGGGLAVTEVTPGVPEVMTPIF